MLKIKIPQSGQKTVRLRDFVTVHAVHSNLRKSMKICFADGLCSLLNHVLTHQTASV